MYTECQEYICSKYNTGTISLTPLDTRFFEALLCGQRAYGINGARLQTHLNYLKCSAYKCSSVKLKYVCN